MRIRNISLAVLAALLMLFVSLSASPAQAQPSGSFDAASKQEWQGYMKGAWTDFWIDNPGLGSGEHWERYLEIGTIHWDHIEQFGVEKCGGGSGGCPICGRDRQSAGLYEFFYTSEINYTHCSQVPNDGINTDMGFTIYENSQDTSLIEYSIMNGPNDMPCGPGVCVERTGAQAWYHIQLVETIKATFTGHKVWGGQWTLNQYMDGNHVFHYQTNAGFMSQGPGNPPQMGWNIGANSYPPAPGNNGGSLASCDYDTGTQCLSRS